MDNPYFVAAAWIALALAASLISIRLGISVALVEIFLGVLAGNLLSLQTPEWIEFLALFGAVVLTFLAGAEIDPDSLRRHLKVSMSVGIVSFAAPAVAAFAFAYLVAGWAFEASLIAGIALSTTSVAVVYAVMLETGLSQRDLGKTILAACFITDLGTVLALGLLFADLNETMLIFIVVSALVLLLLPRMTRWFVTHLPNRVSEPEVKFLFLVLFFLGGLAYSAQSEAVLPAYLAGLMVAGVFVRDRVLVQRIRAIAFSLLTPFYFIKAGLLVSISGIVAGAGLIGALLIVKVAAKSAGVWPVARAVGMPAREATYTTLLMSTGLTFGTISALYGFNNGYIDQLEYTILVTVVILSAVVPTLIATRFFEPRAVAQIAAEDIEAAEEIDAGPLPRPRRRATDGA